MPDTNYYPDGVTQVLQLMRDTLGDGYSYFDDELLDINQTQLPCVMVFEGEGGVKAGASTSDDLGEQIHIVIALNVLDDIGATEQTQLTGNKLRHLIKGQDPETQEWMPGTVMYALRTQFTLANGTVENEVEVDYAPNRRGENVFTKEAYITIRVERIVKVPTRS